MKKIAYPLDSYKSDIDIIKIYVNNNLIKIKRKKKYIKIIFDENIPEDELNKIFTLKFYDKPFKSCKYNINYSYDTLEEIFKISNNFLLFEYKIEPFKWPEESSYIPDLIKKTHYCKFELRNINADVNVIYNNYTQKYDVFKGGINANIKNCIYYMPNNENLESSNMEIFNDSSFKFINIKDNFGYYMIDDCPVYICSDYNLIGSEKDENYNFFHLIYDELPNETFLKIIKLFNLLDFFNKNNYNLYFYNNIKCISFETSDDHSIIFIGQINHEKLIKYLFKNE